MDFPSNLYCKNTDDRTQVICRKRKAEKQKKSSTRKPGWKSVGNQYFSTTMRGKDRHTDTSDFITMGEIKRSSTAFRLTLKSKQINRNIE